MDIPGRCGHWADPVLCSRRRIILLCNTDLQYDLAISDFEQTNLSSELPQFGETSEGRGTPMECRTVDLRSVFYNGPGINLEWG